MKAFKSYGLNMSLSDRNKNAYGHLGFNTETCFWSSSFSINGSKYEYASRSYRKVCEWTTKLIQQFDLH